MSEIGENARRRTHERNEYTVQRAAESTDAGRPAAQTRRGTGAAASTYIHASGDGAQDDGAAAGGWNWGHSHFTRGAGAGGELSRGYPRRADLAPGAAARREYAAGDGVLQSASPQGRPAGMLRR